MPYEEAQQNVAIKLSTHAGQELDIILKGTMKVQVGGHVEVLHEGDSIYYNSATPHGMIATGGEECQFYAIVLRGSEEFAPQQDRFHRLVHQTPGPPGAGDGLLPLCKDRAGRKRHLKVHPL